MITSPRAGMAAARRRRADATRRRIVDAAGPLFVELGYLDTTMSALARAAGVAVQTLYLSFGSKAAVLEATLGAVAADDPPAERAAVRAEPDGPAALTRYAALTAAGLELRHPLDTVLRAAAADPEPAALLERSRRASLDQHARIVDDLGERDGFSDRISLQRATDIVAALLAPEAYALLVVAQGWPAPEWAEWAARHAAADLFPRSTGAMADGRGT